MRRRNLHMATIRIWAGDYTLSGLLGFEVHGKTIGILGTGAIGAVACRIFMVSFGQATRITCSARVPHS